MSLQSTLLILVWVAILLLGLGLAGLLRQVQALAVGPARTMLSGPKLGLAAPSLERLDMNRDEDALIMFVSPSCSICKGLLEHADDWGISAASMRLVVVSRESPALEPSSSLAPTIHLDPSGQLFDDFGIKTTPFMVQVRRGVIVRAAHVGSPALALHFVLEAQEEKVSA